MFRRLCVVLSYFLFFVAALLAIAQFGLLGLDAVLSFIGSKPILLVIADAGSSAGPFNIVLTMWLYMSPIAYAMLFFMLGMGLYFVSALRLR